jgi:hypothetical protein
LPFALFSPNYGILVLMITTKAKTKTKNKNKNKKQNETNHGLISSVYSEK